MIRWRILRRYSIIFNQNRATEWISGSILTCENQYISDFYSFVFRMKPCNWHHGKDTREMYPLKLSDMRHSRCHIKRRCFTRNMVEHYTSGWCKTRVVLIGGGGGGLYFGLQQCPYGLWASSRNHIIEFLLTHSFPKVEQARRECGRAP